MYILAHINQIKWFMIMFIHVPNMIPMENNLGKCPNIQKQTQGDIDSSFKMLYHKP